MAGIAETNYPIPKEELERIAEDVCEKAFGDSSDYNHDDAKQWNHNIINKFLQAVTDSTSSTSEEGEKPHRRYKYAVTSTVIQNLDPPNTASTGTSTADVKSEETNGEVKQRPTSGRRGMHSATGAYWNNETDGIWTYKWEGAERRGCDVVISVIFVAA